MMKKLFYSLLALAVLTTWFVQGIYLYKFSDLTRVELSSDQAVWGQYGDYLGGTLGTYFGFLAFIGVLFTVLLQHQQLEHTRKQSKLDEIQRFVSYAASKVDALMHRSPKIPPEQLRQRLQGNELPLSVHQLLFAVVNLRFGRYHNLSHQAAIARLDDLLGCLRQETAGIVIELQHLVTALQAYAQHGGDASIEDLYRGLYRTEVGALNMFGMLCSDRVASYFNAQQITEEMERHWREMPPALA